MSWMPCFQQDFDNLAVYAVSKDVSDLKVKRTVKYDM
jgi:hypothetical protein